MSENNMDLLIQKFYDATLSSEEEKLLCSYFKSDQVRKEHLKDQSLFLALENRSAYWESKWETPNFGKMVDQVIDDQVKEQEEDERVMQMIDRYANHTKNSPKSKKNVWFCAAAIFLLLLSLSYPLYRTVLNPSLKKRDMTYEEYKKSMLLVSQKLNQGAEQADKANKTFQKTQKLLQQSLILRPNEN